MRPRMMLRFRHADAVIEPKPNRPATIARGPEGGRISLFYGSTFKRGGAPMGAIVADPTAAAGTESRELADYIGAPIDEPTCFHGSMMSESHTSDPSICWFPSNFPIEPYGQLEEQAEELLLAFHTAWQRLSWLSPAQRAFVLNALWWELRLDPVHELALTLMLYDGLPPRDIVRLTWNADERLELLPRTRSLSARLRSAHPGPPDARVFDDDILTVLQQTWNDLCARGQRARPRVHLPDWSRIPNPPEG